MPRYFLKVGYKGARYSGSQVQENARTVQWELERAFSTFLKIPLGLTGSSRTDAGVNAMENFYHFDLDTVLLSPAHAWLKPDGPVRSLYNLNAILPQDIVIHGVYEVASDAHCRFDALAREYHYFVYRLKDPFQDDRAYYFPYQLDGDKMKEAASILLNHQDFSTFSKRGTQNKTTLCQLEHSFWEMEGDTWRYSVKANRFLRGMVRGLVGTMLQVGRGKLSISDFEAAIVAKDPRLADFSVPGQGLFLMRVYYPESILSAQYSSKG
jgi:tRNA pseudouridine38-40 synthase